MNPTPPLNIRALRSTVAALPDTTPDLDDRRDGLLDFLDRYTLSPDPQLAANSARYMALCVERHAMDVLDLLDRVSAIRAAAAAVAGEV